MFKSIIHKGQLVGSELEEIHALLPGEIEDRQQFSVLHHSNPVSRSELRNLSDKLQIDINTLPSRYEPDQIQLVISDMDSTMINIECIDEIADFMQIKPQVSSITEAAMRGEIDFNTSLKRRVSLLENLPEEVLAKVYDERLRLNPGAEILIEGLKSKKVKMALVSGGFTFFTNKLKDRLKLDYTLANVLEIDNQHLSGKVIGEIVNGSRKAQFLSDLCDGLNISSSQAIAIGDGANDLEMLGLAGLGVAYHAKPVVQEQADVAISYAGLDSVLHFLQC